MGETKGNGQMQSHPSLGSSLGQQSGEWLQQGCCGLLCEWGLTEEWVSGCGSGSSSQVELTAVGSIQIQEGREKESRTRPGMLVLGSRIQQECNVSHIYHFKISK